MRQYHLFKAILFSFFSAGLYQDVARRWHGMGFLYAFVVLLITTAMTIAILSISIGMVNIQQNIEDFYQHELKDTGKGWEDVMNSGLNMLSQLPSVTFKGGKATSDAQQPYTIIEPITNKPFFIIDTTGKISGLEGSDAKFLLKENALVMRKAEHREEVRYFSSMSEADELEATYYWNIVEQFPLVTIKNGIASSDVKQPFVVKDPATGDPVGTIDTSGKTPALQDAKGHFLLTSTQLYYELPDDKGVKTEEVFDLANLKEESLKSFLNGTIPTLKKIIIASLILLAPFMALFKWVGVILGLMVLGLLGMVLAAIMRVPGISYETAVRLAAVAATPAMFAYAILPLSLWVCILAALAYLLFAILANRDTHLVATNPSIH